MAVSTTVFDKFFNKDDRDLLIKQVVACAWPISPEDPESLYHWSMSLYVNPEKGVTLDILPAGVDGRTGVLVISSKLEGMPTHDLNRTVTLNIGKDNTTVQDIIQAILDNKRDRYRYDDTGSGCRFWVGTVIEDLEREGRLSGNSLERFLMFVSELYEAEGENRVPMPPRTGVFY
ncbi:hypothetical protein FRB94_001346 [Tulasnella sp. JGI-2019a]|nr:hypothetical protein FRB93_000620 [Tulasnella sp. JGI-2019a]KAG9005703.1 hypothetical protein FRB94_001346 [Tulasnella sp. JGI-2019a]KAG9034971.1 hypothetical protein FRB95_012261 [Tulasnella sp. JGI-2019a]